MRKPPISALRVTKAAVLDDGCPFPLPALPKEIESDANLQRERRWRELQDRYGPQNIQRRQTVPISGGCARCPWDKERLAHEEHSRVATPILPAGLHYDYRGVQSSETGLVLVAL